MPKSINWPKELYDEIVNEEEKSFKIAIRLDSMYADTNYYRVHDIVDVRVDHKVVRKAVISHEMIVTPIEEITDNVLPLFKKSYQSRKLIAEFLKNTYNKPVDEKTIVTIIPYVNLQLAADENVDDPHM